MSTKKLAGRAKRVGKHLQVRPVDRNSAMSSVLASAVEANVGTLIRQAMNVDLDILMRRSVEAMIEGMVVPHMRVRLAELTGSTMQRVLDREIRALRSSTPIPKFSVPLRRRVARPKHDRMGPATKNFPPGSKWKATLSPGSVPKFVVMQTGFTARCDIVDKYGAATFVCGKPPPKPKA